MKLRWVAGPDNSFTARDSELGASVVRYDYSNFTEPDEQGIRKLVITGHYWRAFVRGEPVDRVDYAAAEEAMAAAEAAADTLPRPKPPTRRDEWKRVPNRPE